MRDGRSNPEFWLRLVDISDAAARECVSMEQLVYMLTGIEEGYRDSFDPVVSFEEYVAYKLCGAIRKAVDTAHAH